MQWHQTESFHLLGPNDYGQELVVCDVLHLGNDDASSLLEEPLVASRRIQLVQNICHTIVLASQQNLKCDQRNNLIGSSISWKWII